MEYIKLLGILIVIIGFALKLDSILIIVAAAFTTAFVSGIEITTLVETFGESFVNNRSMTINGLSVNINGYEAKDDNDLADTIVHRINDMLNEDGSVWGK